MPARTPPDYPGARWRLINRGLTKRTTLESGRDVERLLEIPAERKSALWIEADGFAVRTTHYLEIRSTDPATSTQLSGRARHDQASAPKN